jgi:hypothetical protein
VDVKTAHQRKLSWVGHSEHFLAHLAPASDINRPRAWLSFCGVDFLESSGMECATVEKAKGRHRCGACQEKVETANEDTKVSGFEYVIVE